MTTFFEWIYVTEVLIDKGRDVWRTTGQYENVEEAVSHADDTNEKRRTRVRQFKVSKLIPVNDLHLLLCFPRHISAV